MKWIKADGDTEQIILQRIYQSLTGYGSKLHYGNVYHDISGNIINMVYETGSKNNKKAYDIDITVNLKEKSPMTEEDYDNYDKMFDEKLDRDYSDDEQQG